MSSGFNVIRRHSLDATGVRIKELTQALATSRSKLEGSQLETDDIRSQGRMDHSTIKLNDERLSFGTTVYGLDTDYTFEFPQEPDLKYLKCWYMLDHLGAHIRDISGFGNDAYVSGHPTLRRAPLDLGFQQLPNAPGTPVMLFNSGTDVVSQTDGEYIWIPDNETIQFSKYQNGFSIHFRFCCLNFESHYPTDGGSYSRRFASKTDDTNNAWSVLVYSTGTNTGGVEVEIKHNGIDYAKRTYGYAAGMWYQVVVTYNPNAGATQTERIKIYTAGNENSIDSTFGTIPSTTFNLRIGARSSATGFFHGYIHDFRMWFDKVLTQDEVNNINRNELTIEPIEKGHVFIVQYALVQGLLKSKYHVWDVMGRILKVRSHRYNILTRIATVSKTHIYSIRTRVSMFKIHEYNIIELVQRLLTIIYDQGGAILLTKTHKWDIQSSLSQITKTKTHKWNVTGYTGGGGLTTQYVRFQKNTTAGSNITQDVTFNGTPQAIIVWSEETTVNNTFSDGCFTFYGFSDGTHHACISGFAKDGLTTSDTFGGNKSDKVIALTNTAGSVLSEATVAFSTNKATFTWTTNDTAATYIHCMALWGLDKVEVKTFDVGRITTGNQTYTLNDSSLTPTLIHTITATTPTGWSTTYGMTLGFGAATTSNQFSVNNSSRDGYGTSYVSTSYETTRCLVGFNDDTVEQTMAASFSSFAAGQFVLNWVDAPPATSRQFAVLAIDSPNIGVGTFTQPTATGTQNISTPSNVDLVKGLMMFSNAQTTTGTQYYGRLSIGGASGTGSTEQGLIVVGENDLADPTVSVRQNKTGSVTKTITPAATAASTTTQTEAAVSTLGTDQFTLNWTTCDSSTRKFHYIAFGGAEISEVVQTKTHKYNVGGKVTRTHTHRYDVTGTGETYTEVYNVTDTTSYFDLNSSAFATYFVGINMDGNTCNLLNAVPKRVTMRLAKNGSPTGTAYIRIRDAGTNIVRTLGTIDVTTLTASIATYTITDNANTNALNNGYTLTFEYTGGDTSNSVLVYISGTDTYTGTGITIYDIFGWNTDSQYDMSWTVYT